MKKAPNGQFLLGALALSLAALFTGCASKPTQTTAELSAPTPIAAQLAPLQGYWEGVGQNSGVTSNASITITGNSLHFYARTDYWYETTFTLPAGTDPQQLHATIKDGVDFQTDGRDSIGKVVAAIFKLENGTLTLAVAPNPYKPPKTFHSTGARYVLKKVQPQKKHTEPPKTK